MLLLLILIKFDTCVDVIVFFYAEITRIPGAGTQGRQTFGTELYPGCLKPRKCPNTETTNLSKVSFVDVYRGRHSPQIGAANGSIPYGKK